MEPPSKMHGAPPGATTATTSGFATLIHERSSVREYADTPVPDHVVLELLRLTQRAPTAFNTQPYIAIIARTPEHREKVASAMLSTNQAKIRGAPLVVVFAADLEPSKSVPHIQQLRRAEGTPEAVINRIPQYLQTFSGEGTAAGSTAWAFKQTSFAAATLLYAAAAHGLVSCAMEGFDGEALNDALGLSDRYAVPVVVSVGYPRDGTSARVSSRLPLEEVFFEGAFGEPLEQSF